MVATLQGVAPIETYYISRGKESFCRELKIKPRLFRNFPHSYDKVLAESEEQVENNVKLYLATIIFSYKL